MRFEEFRRDIERAVVTAIRKRVPAHLIVAELVTTGARVIFAESEREARRLVVVPPGNVPPDPLLKSDKP